MSLPYRWQVRKYWKEESTVSLENCRIAKRLLNSEISCWLTIRIPPGSVSTCLIFGSGGSDAHSRFRTSIPNFAMRS